jgi:hypothetical protein
MRTTRIQFALVTLAALAIFLPFLALQYDVNGIAEALAIETGQLFHKNHLLYRLIGYAVYRGQEFVGGSSRAILILQVINAVCGSLAVGFAYAIYKRFAHNTLSALAGASLLAFSFTYWLFSTDAAYITVAGMFASASIALLLYSRSRAQTVLSGVLTGLSILTWQASVFLIPALVLLTFQADGDEPRQNRFSKATVYAVTACFVAGMTYTLVALTQRGPTSVSSLAKWFTSYGESGNLPMWGQWEAHRLVAAADSALRSILPTPLAVWPRQIGWTTQRGRIAVDLALAAFGLLTLMAAIRTRAKAVWLLSGYIVFLPFIVWWDPFEPKWFLIPNMFLGAFFSVALAPWFRSRFAASLILGSVLFIGATNFVTTVRPRHHDVGPDRLTAQCVAARMESQDLLLSVEWGWPDYLEYLHKRHTLSLISRSSELDERLSEVHRVGGRVYIPDPKSYTADHLVWLQNQSGIRPEDLNRLSGPPAFSCYGRTILSVRD